ncbi:MAG TPA: bifunctional nicotinamidase/pyrazinamidase [Deltaproteobacteria bacterium]|nr:bifunctional nicotinamidase/pyrazinamidase [Deltaproteobacteria bacterium]
MDVNDLRPLARVALKPGDALIVVDMQNDFMPYGTLPVPGGAAIVPGVNAMMRTFSQAGLSIVLTQDWHPEGHRSFASAHAGKKPYDLYDEPGIGPVLWPDHCVQGTPGADFHPGLDVKLCHAIIRKGFQPHVDSYSGFLENDRQTPTGLHGYLKGRGACRILVCGLAMDYCVFFTASDGVDLGYEVIIFPDLTMPVGSPPDSVSRTLAGLSAKGVTFAAATVKAG